MTSYFDCVVIGAGVAGMTASIYLKRYNINVLLLEKNVPGGQIIQTPKIENYPGFSTIDGATLAMNMMEQINHLNIEYYYGNIEKIVNYQNEKIIYIGKEKIVTKTLIFAIGRKPKKLGLELENELIGRGVSWCATCDGMFYKGEEVAVVGGGNSALEEALFLSKICKKVHILYHGQKMRADEILISKMNNTDNIEVHYFTKVIKLKEKDQKLESVILLEKEQQRELLVKGLFIYIGFEPDSKLTEELEINLDNGYILVNEKMQTNVPGVYACGDIIKKELYQITTAIGEASNAAYQVKKYLSEKF